MPGDGFHIASAYVDVKPDLTGFPEELKAKLDAATSGDSTNARVGVNQGYLDASLAIAKAKIDALTAATRNVNIGTGSGGVLASLAGVDTALKVIQRDVADASADLMMQTDLLRQMRDQWAQNAAAATVYNTTVNEAGQASQQAFYGRYGIIGAVRALGNVKIPLFGGAFGTGILGSIGGIHLLVDGIAEFIAVVGPAMVAATAFGVAASDAFKKVYTQVSNMHTVMDATGQSMYPFTGALEKLHQAVQPQVFQLFGDAINIATQKTGLLSQMAIGTGKAVDQMAARLTVAIQSGGFQVFLSHAVTDFAKLGDIIGNLGGVFANFMRAVPGYAQTLLNLADAGSKVLEWASAVTQPLLQLGLAAHGAFIYLGLAATVGATAVRSSLGLIASVVGNAGLKLASFGGVAEKAGVSMGKFAGMASSAAGLPWGWIAVAAAGVGLLVYQLMSAKDATQQWLGTLQAGIAKVNAGNGLNALVGAQAEVTTRLALAQTQLATSTEHATAANVFQRRSTNISMDGYIHQLTSVKELTSGQQILQDQTQLYNYRLNALGKTYGGVHQAQGLLIAAGVPMSQMLNKNAEQWAQIQAEVAGTSSGYKAMHQTGGLLGADLTTLNTLASAQFTAVSKLNSAWDQMATLVTGSQTSFDTWALAMKGLNIAASGAGSALTVTNGRTSASIHGASQSATAINRQAVSFDGLSKASLQYNQTLEQSLPQMNSILDTLRLANLGTGTYTTAVKDLVAQYLPYVKGNNVLLGQLVELSGGAIPSTVTSYQGLVKWLGVSSDSSSALHGKQAQLKQIIDEATNATDGLTQAFQQQADMITKKLLGDQDQTALAYYHIQQKVEAATAAQLQYGKSSQQAKQAQDKQNTAIIQMGKNLDWSDTRIARMIAEVDKIPLKKALEIVMRGNGSYSINPSTGRSNPTNNPPLTHRAGGGAIYGPGSGTSDSIPAWLSDGEYVVRAAAVNKYGQGFLDAVNAGMYAGGGIVTGNASVVSGQYANTIVSAFQDAMVKSMVTAMKGAISSAKAMSFPGGGSSGPGAAAAQAYARSILPLYGWGAGQMNSLIPLWNQESGWRWNAQNPSSGAYGIPQSLPASKMAAAGADWRTNPATQIRWGLGYIRGRYGSPAGAEAHEQSAGWYHRGGPVRRAGGGPVRLASGGQASSPVAGEFCSTADAGKRRNGLVCRKSADGHHRWEHPSGSSSSSGGSSGSHSLSSERTAGSSLMNFYLSPQTAAAIMKEQTKFLEDIAHYYTGSARKWRDAMVMRQTRHLENVDSKLSKLNSQIQAAKSFQSGIQSGLASYAGLSGLDSFGNLMVPGVKPGQSVGQGLESQLKLKLSNLRKWQSDITRLRRAKVSPALISQVAQMDPETGMQYAEAILAGGHSLIHQLNATEAQVGAIEKSTAKAATRAVYGKSISAMWGDEHELKKAAQFFGRELAKEAAKWFRVPRNQQPPAVLHFHGAHPTAEEKHQLMRDLALVIG